MAKGLSSLKETIQNVKMVLSLFTLMEEFRDLSVPKWNFKKILETKLTSLLKQQHAYWKQRGTIKWVTLGDANTKFFHANASARFRRNLITTLEDSTGTQIVEHSQKASLIWLAFKERLGTSSF